ncbi:serine protease inhibitor A6-like [Aquarana catesbeiana]|uniref:serine protease inhibitor A6-like n=1 Tax=Aquarana catesbeiana TaxID=8400 RepID=UPI003CC98206
MKILLLLQLFISLVLAAHTSKQDRAHNTNHLSKSEESDVSECQMNFAVRIFQQHFKGFGPIPPSNLVLSPISIYTTLSMLALGARGTTRDEIFLTLGLDETTKDKVLNQGNRKILQALSQKTKDVKFKLGNEIFTDQSVSISEEYQEDVAHYYNASFHSISFSDPQNAAKIINKIVSDRTDHKIKNVVQNLDSKTLMVLLDYAVFRGKWYTEFDKKLTEKGTFNVNQEKKVVVTMLKRPGLYKAYRDHKTGTFIVKVPYAGDLSLLLFIPQLGGLRHFRNSLNAPMIKKYLRLMQSSTLILYIPKISFNQPIDLQHDLSVMGMRKMFSETDANFSGMSMNKKMSVSNIYHQSYFSIDEERTEARGATAVQLNVDLPSPIVMADRPFIFMIYHKVAKTILWIGQIIDPSQ